MTRQRQAAGCRRTRGRVARKRQRIQSGTCQSRVQALKAVGTERQESLMVLSLLRSSTMRFAERFARLGRWLRR
jgi:hypothetical protein